MRYRYLEKTGAHLFYGLIKQKCSDYCFWWPNSAVVEIKKNYPGLKFVSMYKWHNDPWQACIVVWRPHKNETCAMIGHFVFTPFSLVVLVTSDRLSLEAFVCNCVRSFRPRQNARHLPDDIFKSTFLNENVWISLKISLKFVLEVRINNIPSLVQIMAWRLPGDKPLSEPMMDDSLTHICVTRPQWVKIMRKVSYVVALLVTYSRDCINESKTPARYFISYLGR